MTHNVDLEGDYDGIDRGSIELGTIKRHLCSSNSANLRRSHVFRKGTVTCNHTLRTLHVVI